MKAIDDDKIQQNALKIGGLFMSKLKSLQKKYEFIGDVRGYGLFIGVEIVKDQKSHEPSKEDAVEVFEMCKEMGLIMGKGGMYGNILRVMPPMCVNEDDAQFAYDVLDYVCDYYMKNMRKKQTTTK